MSRARVLALIDSRMRECEDAACVSPAHAAATLLTLALLRRDIASAGGRDAD